MKREHSAEEYNRGMRVKTSVTLPKELLLKMDRADRNRSAFIERAARAYLERLERTRRDARDLKILNENSECLNAEAEDVLEYQDLP
jgi:metal-responsive CopG/Arc/MetJ family transcriptional regulator